MDEHMERAGRPMTLADEVRAWTGKVSGPLIPNDDDERALVQHVLAASRQIKARTGVAPNWAGPMAMPREAAGFDREALAADQTGLPRTHEELLAEFIAMREEYLYGDQVEREFCAWAAKYRKAHGLDRRELESMVNDARLLLSAVAFSVVFVPAEHHGWAIFRASNNLMGISALEVKRFSDPVTGADRTILESVVVPMSLPLARDGRGAILAALADMEAGR